MAVMTAAKIPVLQVVHGTDSPFLELSGRYAGVFGRDRFHVTTVFLTGAGSDKAEKLANSDRVIFLDLPSSALSGMKRRAIAPVAELCKVQDFALVIAQRYKALYVAWKVARHLSAPRILGVAHAFGVMDDWGRRFLFRRALRHTWLAGVSQAVADDLRQHCGASLSKHVVALPNCVDVAAIDKGLFPAVVARNVLDIPEEAFVFANVGRLHPDKDQLSLLEAFAQAAPAMPTACLLLVGEGRLQDRLQARIRELGLGQRVKLTGKVANVARCFAAFDAYVSTSDREPFGIVLNEAQAARLPVIAADCGGAAEVVADSGLLYSRREPQRLPALLQQVYAMSADERRALGERGRERLQAQFSLQAFARRFRALEVAAPLWEDPAP